MKPRYTEWSDYLEDEASSEPECVGCPYRSCENGRVWSVGQRKFVDCQLCRGRGFINPNLWQE